MPSPTDARPIVGAHIIALTDLPPLLAFVAAVCSRPSVSKLGYATDGCRADFWVLVEEEDVAEREALFSTQLQYEKATPDGFRFSLHMVPLTEVVLENLPSLDIIFER